MCMTDVSQPPDRLVGRALRARPVSAGGRQSRAAERTAHLRMRQSGIGIKSNDQH